MSATMSLNDKNSSVRYDNARSKPGCDTINKQTTLPGSHGRGEDKDKDAVYTDEDVNDGQTYATQVAKDRQQYWDYAYPEDGSDNEPPHRGGDIKKNTQPKPKPRPAPDNQPKPRPKPPKE